jgi:hypothetical protein
MAIKLFNRKQELSDPYVRLDELMIKMADTETYLEYVKLRGKV